MSTDCYIVELRHEVPAKAHQEEIKKLSGWQLFVTPAIVEAEQEELEFKPTLRSQDQPKIYNETVSKIKFAEAGNVVVEYIRS